MVTNMKAQPHNVVAYFFSTRNTQDTLTEFKDQYAVAGVLFGSVAAGVVVHIVSILASVKLPIQARGL